MTDDAQRTPQLATLGAGCFWCIEAVLQQVEGVLAVTPGYMGGHVDHPTYRQVCAATTGHAEVAQVEFDPARLGYAQLLAWFWKLHDPTTKDRQGNDTGPQYRSAIFVHDAGQREVAQRSLQAAQAAFDQPIVTEITDAGRFWPAEDDHRDYYRNNREQGYCQYVIAPKLDKLGLTP